MKIVKQIFLFFGYFVGAILLLVAVALLFLSRSYTPQIKGTNSIASLEKIRMGGIKQTVLIRSKDISNQILLFLHGGPGSPLMPFTHVSDRELEERLSWYTGTSGVPENLIIKKHESGRLNHLAVSFRYPRANQLPP